MQKKEKFLCVEWAKIITECPLLWWFLTKTKRESRAYSTLFYWWLRRTHSAKVFSCWRDFGLENRRKCELQSIVYHSKVSPRIANGHFEGGSSPSFPFEISSRWGTSKWSRLKSKCSELRKWWKLSAIDFKSEAMIEFDDFVLLIHQINATFGILVDWLGDAFMQVGLGVVIWAGYVRHWVSWVLFQCRCRMSCFACLFKFAPLTRFMWEGSSVRWRLKSRLNENS